MTQRHVSFVESGRANPSREMVLSLARALDVPLRERNQMLLAAGYAPHYRETGLDDEAMAQVRAALDRVLAHHEPYPAVVMDRHWNILRANDAARAMFAFLLDGTARRDAGERRAADVHDAAAARRQLGADRRGAGPACPSRGGRRRPGPADRGAARRGPRAAGHPAGVAAPDFVATAAADGPGASSPRTASTVSYFSMVTTVGTPQDVTLQELRIESFFPADAATAEHRWR